MYISIVHSPSSCLSDKEEDEIYGFGYGVFAAQIARQQQQRLMGYAPTSHQPLLLQQQHNYQTDGNNRLLLSPNHEIISNLQL
ncbi:hypothetical protein NQ317_000966 [Molorchus minor]|uniref:Uncharacterized protein n=1 Tax=Molorchus minor TaxID=1323400 RepID=A0ABQ9IW46_9CUCU|nr:hypothetical protein NQ317_000966 [Molorchus minor]